jgi:hypothetical protein
MSYSVGLYYESALFCLILVYLKANYRRIISLEIQITIKIKI